MNLYEMSRWTGAVEVEWALTSNRLFTFIDADIRDNNSDETGCSGEYAFYEKGRFLFAFDDEDVDCEITGYLTNGNTFQSTLIINNGKFAARVQAAYKNVHNCDYAVSYDLDGENLVSQQWSTPLPFYNFFNVLRDIQKMQKKNPGIVFRIYYNKHVVQQSNYIPEEIIALLQEAPTAESGAIYIPGIVCEWLEF